jgi:hypothetical protein
MAKVWPAVLAPLWFARRERTGLAVAAAVVVAIGGWWCLAGGPKGPFQVLTFRDARGWHTQSVVGGLQWLLGIGGTAYREADAWRIGHASLVARGLLVGVLAVLLWFTWRRAGRETAAGAPLVAVASLLVVSPLVSVQAALWLLPWTALAGEGDPDDRRAAVWSAAAIVLTGFLAIAWPDPTVGPSWWLRVLVTARNVALVGTVAVWLWSRRTTPEGAHVAAAAS